MVLVGVALETGCMILHIYPAWLIQMSKHCDNNIGWNAYIKREPPVFSMAVFKQLYIHLRKEHHYCHDFSLSTSTRTYRLQVVVWSTRILELHVKNQHFRLTSSCASL